MKTKYKAGVYILAILLVILISIYTVDLLYFTKFPAVAILGMGLIIFLLLVDIIANLFVCPICKGMGALNLTLRQDIINSFSPGRLGERCTHCNGSGFINLRKFYLKQIKKEDGRK